MPTEPSLQLTRRSLADQVSDALVEYIRAESLEDGDSLPSAADLASRFGVSRTVIREALAVLAGRGILTRSQGRETVVATPDASNLVNLLEFRIHRDEVTLLNILDARLGLEVQSAALAAQHATEHQLDGIDQHMKALVDANNDRAYHDADIALHRAIAVAAANPLIVLILDALGDFLRDFRVRATQDRKSRGESLQPIVDQHRQIVDAIHARDSREASEAMRTHLETARIYVS